MTVLNDFGQTTVITRTTKCHCIQTCRNTLVWIPALALPTWQVVCKYWKLFVEECMPNFPGKLNVLFLAQLPSPKASYFVLKSICFSHQKKPQSHWLRNCIINPQCHFLGTDSNICQLSSTDLVLKWLKKRNINSTSFCLKQKWKKQNQTSSCLTMGSTLLNTDDGNDLHPNLALSSSCHSQVHRKKKQEEITVRSFFTIQPSCIIQSFYAIRLFTISSKPIYFYQLFTWSNSNKTRGNCFKSEERKFRGDDRKTFFTLRVVRHWLPRQAVDASISGRLDGALGSLISWVVILPTAGVWN